jgi:NADH:ubiquinone oxidoreductase subunit 6 (subunit J)
MEMTLPEDTLIITTDTPKVDPAWQVAGIADPTNEIKTMKEMGVQAILYDPNTASTVRVLSKTTSDSREVFHLSLLDEDELAAYLDTIFSTTDENTAYTIEQYPQDEIPFYRLTLQLTKDGTKYSEIVYGTIANGSSISFDIYAKNNTEPMDESYLKELVANTHFTEFQDKAEVEKQQRNAITFLVTALAIIIGIIVVWILINQRTKKKQKLIKKQKAEELSRFFTTQREKEEQNSKDSPVMINRTKYTEEVIQTFYTFDRLWKHIKLWIITAIVFLLFLASFYTSGSILVCVISIAVVIIFIYYQYIQTEKVITREVKSYKSNKNKEAVFTFYEEYYTLSGIQSSSKFPYLQITEIKEYKDYYYLYLGSERAHYLKKDGFEHGTTEFLELIKKHVTLK